MRVSVLAWCSYKFYILQTKMPLTLKNFNQQWWKPWANTIAYYKFNNNLNDSSWNSRNLSLLSGSVSYGVASWWGEYAYFNTSTSASVSMPTVNYGNDNYTVSFYRQPKQIFSWFQCIFDWVRDTMQDPWYIRVTKSIYVWDDINYTAAVDTWYYITVVRSWQNISAYINWTYIGSYQAVSWVYWTKLFINQIWNSSSYKNNNYLWEFIIEDKARTADEITAYYNQTKSLYWIS